MTSAQETVETYIAAWNESDPGRMAELVMRAVADDAVLVSAQYAVTGARMLVEFIAGFRATRPNDRAMLTSKVESVGNRFRFTGCGIDGDGKSYGEVMDVGELDGNGRIKSLVTFDTPLPPKV